MHTRTFSKNIRARASLHARTRSRNARTLSRNVYICASAIICTRASTSILACTNEFLFVCVRASASICIRAPAIIRACGGFSVCMYVVLS